MKMLKRVSVDAGAILIVGARKHVFPKEFQNSKRIIWWGPVAERKDAILGRLDTVFAKENLERFDSVQRLASKRGARFFGFSSDKEVETALAELLEDESALDEGFSEAPTISGNGHERSKKALTAVSEGSIVNIPVSRIRRFKGQPRTYFHQASLLRLGRSMLKAGQKVPVIVVKIEGDPEHDYQLCDGERRWRAAQLVQKDTLRAIVAESVSETELFKTSAICNFGREEHGLMETALALKKVRENDNLTLEELAETFCHPVTWINQRLQLLKLHPEVQALINPELPEEEQVTLMMAQEIAKVPSNFQPLASKHILENKLDLTQARHYIRKLAAEVGFSSERRKRKPYDDLKVFRGFIVRTNIRLEQFLDLPDRPIGSIFRNQPFSVKNDAIADLNSIIVRLRQIQTSIKREVKTIA